MNSPVKKYVIANWKMHGRNDFVQDWCQGMAAVRGSVQVLVAPPTVYLQRTLDLAPDLIQLAAQDVAVYAKDGAHTGEVSAQMLVDIGCQYVIIGHSERRALGETNEILLQKLMCSLEAGLIPIFCVGESLEVRESKQAWSFVQAQLSLLDGYPKEKPLIVAYEPIWAIGTGMTATIEDIEHMHDLIQQMIDRPILYGGSVKPSNAKEILNAKAVGGALVGGASLKPEEFLAIVEAAS